MNQLDLFNTTKTNEEEDMGSYRTFYEETDNKHKAKLSLWRNQDNKLFIEMQEDCLESDPYTYQCITLDEYDAKELIQEIQSIINQMTEQK